EPGKEAEDADLLAGLARRDQVAEVVAPPALRRERRLVAAVPTESAADRHAEGERAGSERERRPPLVDDADEHRRDGPLQVHREQEERRPARPAGGEPRAAPMVDE